MSFLVVVAIVVPVLLAIELVLRRRDRRIASKEAVLLVRSILREQHDALDSHDSPQK